MSFTDTLTKIGLGVLEELLGPLVPESLRPAVPVLLAAVAQLPEDMAKRRRALEQLVVARQGFVEAASVAETPEARRAAMRDFYLGLAAALDEDGVLDHG